MELAVLALSLAVLATSARLWEKLGWIGLNHVWPAWAEVAGWWLRGIRPGTRWWPRALVLRAYAASDRGDTRRAVAEADALLEVARAAHPDVCDWYLVNSATDLYVNAGCYRKALAAAERWSEAAQERGRVQGPRLHAFAMINRAEALHNVGEHEAALRLLAEVEPQANDDVVYSREGLVLLRAWILAHVDRASEAWTELRTIDPRALGPRYRAEYCFTRALTLCARGDVAAAERAAREGLARARRAASRRNALQIAARVAVAAHDDTRAIDLLERARRDVYQGQAAPGLVLLAAVYQRAGRSAEARRAHDDARALDPESYLVR